MVKRILMVAFQYPPFTGSSALQRTLKFSRYLLEHDWQPTILSAHPMAYVQTGDDQVGEIPEQVRVVRAWSLDAARHLSVRGRYPRQLALPDRWSSWSLAAVPAGLSIIRREKPAVIWSTYPIASTHVIASVLHRMTGLPWVADFRDLMLEDDYPEDLKLRRIHQRIESGAVFRSSRIVVTTPGALDVLARRYPEQPTEKWRCIRNGYDEDDFPSTGEARPPRTTDQIRLVHSGFLYPSERDPSAFFNAISELKRENLVDSSTLRVILRAAGAEQHHLALIRQAGIEDIVSLAPGVTHAEAVAEMIAADGLLLFQAANCNNQVPAKLYEYMRAGRPILALTDPTGDTAITMREAGVGDVVRLDNVNDIKLGLLRFFGTIKNDVGTAPDPDQLKNYSRRGATADLAGLLDELTDK